MWNVLFVPLGFNTFVFSFHGDMSEPPVAPMPVFKPSGQPVFCVITHNISGHAIMETEISPTFRIACQSVNAKRHFGQNQCLFTPRGNVMFKSRARTLHYKGARNMDALVSLLEHITAGPILRMFVSMMVVTTRLHQTINTKLHNNLRQCISMLDYQHEGFKIVPVCEEQPSTVMFRITKWGNFITNEDDRTLMEGVLAVFTLTRMGALTCRFTFPKLMSKTSAKRVPIIVHYVTVRIMQLLVDKTTSIGKGS
jgi:hypothetical protein